MFIYTAKLSEASKFVVKNNIFPSYDHEYCTENGQRIHRLSSVILQRNWLIKHFMQYSC